MLHPKIQCRIWTSLLGSILLLKFGLIVVVQGKPGELVDNIKDEVGRDLGADRLKNGSITQPVFDIAALGGLPNILLKKQKKVKNSDKVTDPIAVDPQECVETKFLHPFHPTYSFPDASKLREMRANTNCNWAFIGTEVCVPKLTCSTFKLPSDCDKNYMLVVDGNKGMQKFCGEKGPKNIIAANKLRDLFIQVNGSNKADIKCEIECTQRGVGEPLFSVFEPKVEQKCMCGQKPGTDRIVNGYAGKKSEFPWIVAMVEAQTRQPFCGASIVNDRFILTAAHCFKGKYMDYRRIQLILEGEVLDVMPNAGITATKPEPMIYPQSELDALDKGNGSVRYNIEEIFIHPLYVSETNDFDVALVRTVETINITWKGQTPVCLPKLGSYHMTFAHKPAIVAGWGLPSAEAPGTNSLLQKLNLTVFSPKLCKEYYVHRVNKRMMCAGYKEGGRDSCMGDSGGPLIIETQPRVWTQVGTVSWGEGCALERNPGVYYRTTESGQWVNYISNLMGATWCSAPREAAAG